MTRNRVRQMSCLLVSIVIAYGAYVLTSHRFVSAQDQAGTKMGAGVGVAETKVKPLGSLPFLELRDKRDEIEQNTLGTQKLLDTLDGQLFWLNEAKKLGDQLAEARKAKNPQKDLISELEKKKREAEGNAPTSDNVGQVTAKIEKAQKELGELKSSKSRVETAISQKIDIEKPKQDFKLIVSLLFALLIAMIIVGFFYVSIKDDTVRREIFRGQAGIQFITLFSIVIAIILFGISGILEGKELAALLGGLSGYILGRTTSQSTPPVQAKTISSPVITGISPNEATAGGSLSAVSLQIVGSDLQLANSVKIVHGGVNEISVSDITSNNLMITCKLTLDANQPKGKYDVIVTNSDGATAQLLQAFTVK